MEEVFVHNIPDNKNLSQFFKMCYVLIDIRHRSGVTESAQWRCVLISCSGHSFDIRLVGRLSHIKESLNDFSRTS